MVVVVLANRFDLRGNNTELRFRSVVGFTAVFVPLSNESSNDCGRGVRLAENAGRLRVGVSGLLDELSLSSVFTVGAVVVERVDRFSAGLLRDGKNDFAVELAGCCSCSCSSG